MTTQKPLVGRVLYDLAPIILGAIIAVGAYYFKAINDVDKASGLNTQAILSLKEEQDRQSMRQDRFEEIVIANNNSIIALTVQVEYLSEYLKQIVDKVEDNLIAK
jgi:hypothetical protein|tara:strand:+ start:2563 stop:2877 length:315 start_codon:yes stop_codon:yes gene_type:complete